MPVITMRPARRIPRTVAAGGALGVSLAALWLWASPGDRMPVAPVPLRAAPAATEDVAPAALAIAAVAPEQAPIPSRPPPIAREDAASTAPPPGPYRFVGRMAVEGESALIFFGRGGTVVLRAPGPLDEEFVVDAILEDQALLRHVPTSTAQFIALSPHHSRAATPDSLEGYPQD